MFFALIANITMTITTNINFCLTFLRFQFGILYIAPILFSIRSNVIGPFFATVKGTFLLNSCLTSSPSWPKLISSFVFSVTGRQSQMAPVSSSSFFLIVPWPITDKDSEQSANHRLGFRAICQLESCWQVFRQPIRNRVFRTLTGRYSPYRHQVTVTKLFDPKGFYLLISR